MTKTNLWQIIVGIVVTAICGLILNMERASFLPTLILAIGWAGFKQISGKTFKDNRGNYVYPAFWKDFLPVLAGGGVMWIIVMIGEWQNNIRV